MNSALVCLALGVCFGIVLIKAEVASWWRIQEMFRFQSVHMYRIIGIAVAALGVTLLRVFRLTAIGGSAIDLRAKPVQYRAHLFGGIVFGRGWALTRACPGPMCALVGAGHLPMIAVLLSALAGTYACGLVRDQLPH